MSTTKSLFMSLAVMLGISVSIASHSFCEKRHNHGCSSFCGYKSVKAGNEFICAPAGKRSPFPYKTDSEDVEEYCEIVAKNYGCEFLCGFKWDAKIHGCVDPRKSTKKASKKTLRSGQNDEPIIGGQGKFRYQYMPNLMKPPAGTDWANCHGLVTDKDNNIYLTYQNKGDDKNCLIRWDPDGTNAKFMTGGNTTLCDGTPHGLKIKSEDGVEYLYHANNNQKLTKTTLDGTVLWQINGLFGQDTQVYRPTWFATPPSSDYMYLCDGYGSNQVYAFSKDGKFMNKTWGGKSPTKGPDAPHGTFSTNHGCTYDSRIPDENRIIVSDRANSRLEFFEYDPSSYDKFEWKSTVDLQPGLGNGTLPCNIRMYPEQDGRAIIPDLAGPVGVLDANNAVISVIKVSELLAHEQANHPHDAIFLPNGDFVVATWAPGTVTYWKLLPSDE